MRKAKCDKNGKPTMKSWGIGEGNLPFTDDPENPFKPFAEYEEEDEVSPRKKGMRKKISPHGGR